MVRLSGLLGFACIVAAAFLVALPAGLAVLGAILVYLAAINDGPATDAGREE